MKILDIGEFGLISHIKEWVKKENPEVFRGVGDDTAVISLSRYKYLLFTCDTQVEGIHFLLSFTTPYLLGRKSIAINVSDIASMGGTPSYALVSLILPQETELSFLIELYRGLVEEGNKWGVTIVGGNISRTNGPLTVDISLLGEVKKKHLKLRSRAKEGDLIIITGHPGRSAAGLKLLQANKSKDFSELTSAHLSPTPRLREALLIASYPEVSSMIDVSDGVLQDLGHILKESSVGAIIKEDALPITEYLKQAAEVLGEEAINLFLNGGEDYELIFTVSPDNSEKILKKVKKETGTNLSVIGEINDHFSNISLITQSRDKINLKAGGWDHFKDIK
ncbi:MAG: Thiamine-monophosphate kinase [candidate division WS2 bacterium]|uniref:Thiamine-monophosphate kinase n=1 Tax=Psychracetigena formicireducens TaxID=2986056 RepID=A0A9E2BHW9_PSYF1|nr:Thiamine-monophosphate kinase [Candidatus Psychracetigena formicireducens]